MKIRRGIVIPIMAGILAVLAVACAGATPAASPTEVPEQPAPGNTPPPSTEIKTEEVLAPIESVEINIAESFPPQYFLLVKSGLPSGCAQFKDYEVNRDGNHINVKVTNLEPAPGQQIACTMIYGIKETNIALGSDFEGGQTYTVVVNGDTTENFVAQGGEQNEPNMVEVPSPIEKVDVMATASIPPIYALKITVGLPDGCTEFHDSQITRDGDNIKVRLTNLRPAPDADIACIQVYRTIDHDLVLGSDFDPDRKYTLDVNGVLGTLREGMSPGGGPDSGKVSVPAPIESVSIEIVRPDDAIMQIISRLPGGCYEHEGHTFDYDGDTFHIQVTNLGPADPNTPCTKILGIHETTISLGGDIEACKVYEVVVNGKVFHVQAIAPNVRCASPEPIEPEIPMVEVLSPIESVEINVAESFPPQYFALVRSGLPSGCVKFDAYDVTRAGDTINIKVTNLQPAPDVEVFCTLIYGIKETNIPLGSDFEGGKTYTVNVNGEVTETFVAQESGSPSGRIRLDFGEAALVETEALKIEFIEVLEDSRCPANVVCIWAGRARILVDVATIDGENLGQHELTLEPGSVDQPGVGIGEYQVRLVALDPYPGTTELIEDSDYTATVEVSRADTEVKVNLKAEPGDQPLTMRFVAELVGGPDNNRDLYCTGMGWDFGDGMRLEAIPGCIEWSPDIEIERHFEQIYTYEAPGSYEVSFHHGSVNGSLVVNVG